jgi:hypothetical protein
MVPDQDQACFRPSRPTQESRSTLKRSSTALLEEESRIWRRRLSSRDNEDDDGDSSVGSQSYYTSEKENEFLSGYGLEIPEADEVCRHPPLLRARSCTDPEEDYLFQDVEESRNDCDTFGEIQYDVPYQQEGQEVILSPMTLQDVVSRDHVDLEDEEDDDDDLPPWMFANRANRSKQGLCFDRKSTPMFLGGDSSSQELCVLLQGSPAGMFGIQ